MLRRLIDWWRAWRRGERRIAPTATRGRIWAKKPGSVEPTQAKPKAKISFTVTRVKR